VIGEILLTPIEKCARGPALCGGYHFLIMKNPEETFNSIKNLLTIYIYRIYMLT
jgi:hypothetical protein